MTQAILAELDGLRTLVRALVHGDADADDLIQDAALAALEHPPALDRPVRPWLATVIRNRWRSSRRATVRREAREQAVAPAEAVDGDEPIERARMLERLASALVALDEPYRTAVIRRYLDGQTAADLARELGVPAGTVRWRLKTGLDRLRMALDDSKPRKQWAALLLAPRVLAKGVTVMKAKTVSAAVIAAVVLIGVGVVVITRSRAPTPAPAPHAPAVPPRASVAPRAPAPAAVEPPPGQARATVASAEAAGGVVAGRVVNWSTGDAVDGAELTFAGDAGALTVRAQASGAFELAPAAPGKFVLVAASAPGFLPYAPEFLTSNVVATTTRDRGVNGITVFLYPALDYHGTVVDAAGKPVAGAHVRLLGSLAGEQAIDKLATEWTSDAAGQFTFHAADNAVLEAVRGKQRGWARLDGKVAISKQLVVKLGDAAARDAQIIGRVVDSDGKPVPEVLVRADPDARGSENARAPAAATSGPDGGFVLAGLDRGAYTLSAEADGFAPVIVDHVVGGSHGVELVLAAGEIVSGTVVTPSGAPVPSYTLLVLRRDGARRDEVTARSIVDASGRFELHLAHGDYDISASANGWAPAKVAATAPSHDLRIAVSEGATVRGTVTSNIDQSGLQYVRVMRETSGGGASLAPANAGTVTREDGSFELTGIPPGPFALTFGAGGFDEKIEAGLTARDSEIIGPLAIVMTKLGEGEAPHIELVGIGVKLVADSDAIRVETVIPGGGAAAAGIVADDRIVAVNGANVADLGLDGALTAIRGPEGTTVTLSLRRPSGIVAVTVQRHKLRA